MDEAGLPAFLVRAARTVEPGAAVFAGFNWPMLATRLARRLGRDVSELYEAGAVLTRAPDLLPSSSTDYDAYAGSTAWRGSTLDLLAMVPRLAAVLLDAASVDVRGCVNTFGEGPAALPTFRSAGGGGSADVAARARRLVLLHAGAKPTRIARRVSAVTAAPRPEASVLLLTRWGTLEAGAHPRLVELVPGSAGFVEHLESLGVDVAAPRATVPPTATECAAALAVLQEASTRGYRAALPT